MITTAVRNNDFFIFLNFHIYLHTDAICKDLTATCDVDVTSDARRVLPVR